MNTAACTQAAIALTYAVLSCVLLTTSGCRKPQTILAPPKAGQGQTQVIEAGGPDGDIGWWPQVRFDAHNRAHVAYCDAHLGHLRYGIETPTGWALETVAPKGKTGKYISLAIRPDGGVGITYYDQSTHYFDYATRQAPGEAWHIEHIAWGPEAGMASALRYSADGQAHVIYYINSGKLFFAKRTPEGNWLKTHVGNYQAVYSAHTGALSEAKGLWFSYVNWQMDAATLYLGHLDDTGWHQSIVPTQRGAGWRSQLTRVGDDLWVVHSDSLTENTVLSFVTPDDQWHTLMLVHGGSSFAVDAHHGRGVMAFAQRDKRRRGLYLTQQTEIGPWPVQTIALNVGNDPDVSMAIDSHGRVIVVYYDVSTHGLKSYSTQLEEQTPPN